MKTMRIALIGDAYGGKTNIIEGWANSLRENGPAIFGEPTFSELSEMTTFIRTEGFRYHQGYIKYQTGSSTVSGNLILIDTQGGYLLHDTQKAILDEELVPLEQFEPQQKEAWISHVNRLKGNWELVEGREDTVELPQDERHQHSEQEKKSTAKGKVDESTSEVLKPFLLLPKLFRETATCDALLLTIAPEDFDKDNFSDFLTRLVAHVRTNRRLNCTDGLKVAVVFSKIDTYCNANAVRLFQEPEFFAGLAELKQSSSSTFHTDWVRFIDRFFKSTPQEEYDLQRTLMLNTELLWRELIQVLDFKKDSLNAYFVAAGPVDSSHTPHYQRGVLQLFSDTLYAILSRSQAQKSRPPSPIFVGSLLLLAVAVLSIGSFNWLNSRTIATFAATHHPFSCEFNRANLKPALLNAKNDTLQHQMIGHHLLYKHVRCLYKDKLLAALGDKTLPIGAYKAGVSRHKVRSYQTICTGREGTLQACMRQIKTFFEDLSPLEKNALPTSGKLITYIATLKSDVESVIQIGKALERLRSLQYPDAKQPDTKKAERIKTIRNAIQVIKEQMALLKKRDKARWKTKSKSLVSFVHQWVQRSFYERLNAKKPFAKEYLTLLQDPKSYALHQLQTNPYSYTWRKQVNLPVDRPRGLVFVKALPSKTETNIKEITLCLEKQKNASSNIKCDVLIDTRKGMIRDQGSWKSVLSQALSGTLTIRRVYLVSQKHGKPTTDTITVAYAQAGKHKFPAKLWLEEVVRRLKRTQESHKCELPSDLTWQIPARLRSFPTIRTALNQAICQLYLTNSKQHCSTLRTYLNREETLRKTQIRSETCQNITLASQSILQKVKEEREKQQNKCTGQLKQQAHRHKQSMSKEETRRAELAKKLQNTTRTLKTWKALQRKSHKQLKKKREFLKSVSRFFSDKVHRPADVFRRELEEWEGKKGFAAFCKDKDAKQKLLSWIQQVGKITRALAKEKKQASQGAFQVEFWSKTIHDIERRFTEIKAKLEGVVHYFPRKNAKKGQGNINARFLGEAVKKLIRPQCTAKVKQDLDATKQLVRHVMFHLRLLNGTVSQAGRDFEQLLELSEMPKSPQQKQPSPSKKEK